LGAILTSGSWRTKEEGKEDMIEKRINIRERR
jgi:hypothetical protein